MIFKAFSSNFRQSCRIEIYPIFTVVRSVIAILLSFLIYFQGAGLGVDDLLLMGSLIEHAEYHSENHGDDFFTFLNKHYGNQKEQHHQKYEDEQQDHEELPFQHESCNHSIAEVVLVGYQYPLEKPVIVSSPEVNFHYKNLYSSLEKSYIFQPPKVA